MQPWWAEETSFKNDFILCQLYDENQLYTPPWTFKTIRSSVFKFIYKIFNKYNICDPRPQNQS